MSNIAVISIWVSASIVLAMAIGYYIGRTLGKYERQVVLKAMLNLLEQTNELSSEMDTHHADLSDVGRSVEDLELNDELGELQATLLEKVSQVIRSNERLEDDLVRARYTLEQQTQELDVTRREARTDHLSGVANRMDFDETLEYWLIRSKRTQESFALVLLDIDHFKWINDTHGHAAGDIVVKHVGKFLSSFLRPKDYVARYGGDEFALLLAWDSMAEAVQFAESLREGTAQQNFGAWSSGHVAVTFSVGLAMNHMEDTSESLLHRADAALYASKQGGRNQLNWRTPDDEVPEPAHEHSTA